MISKQPDQTAYLLNKLVQEGVGGTGGGDIKLYTTTGQHTDGAMTQKATTDALGTKADTITVGNQLAGKVDKETGKGLSSNDFTDEELAKLNGIEAGAEVNVQADWDQTNTSADDYIKNKPTLATVATSGDYDDLLNKPVIPPGAVLYSTTGQNTDGAMTQKASTDLFNVAAYIDTGTIGSPTPWVDTSDIVDGAVTATKLDYTTNGATAIPANSDLNTTSFITPGRYVCRLTSTAATLSNCPSASAFNMTVINALSAVKDISDTSLWMYFVRILTNCFGGAYVQAVYNSGTSTWTYGRWMRLSSDQTYLTGNDAGTINTTYVNSYGGAHTVHRIGDMVVVNINISMKAGSVPNEAVLISNLPRCGGGAPIVSTMVGANGQGVRLIMKNGETSLLADGGFTATAQYYNGQIVYMS